MEIIPKPEQENTGSNAFFTLAILLLVFAVGSFIVFLQLQARETKTIAALEQSLNANKTQEQKNLEQEVLGYQKKIADFKVFAQSLQDPLRFFQFLETYTNPKVFFSGARLDSSNMVMILEGETPDFATLDEQVLAFRQRSEVEKAVLSNVGIGENGRVKFALELAFSQNIFK